MVATATGLAGRRAATAGETHTCDDGVLILVDGLWEVVKSGDLNEADAVWNVLRSPT